MPFELRVIQESFPATFDRTDVLAFTMGHKMLSERWGVLEGFPATKHMTGVDLGSSFYKFWLANDEE